LSVLSDGVNQWQSNSVPILGNTHPLSQIRPNSAPHEDVGSYERNGASVIRITDRGITRYKMGAPI